MPLLLRSYFRYAETVLLQMNQSIVTLTSWMAANLLLFNPSKTQAIWLRWPHQACKDWLSKAIFSLSSHNLFYFCAPPRCHAWSWAHFIASYQFSCPSMLLSLPFCPRTVLSVRPASGGFPISYLPIETHPRPRMCDQPYWHLLLFASMVPWPGWTEFCARLPGMLAGCPSFLPSLLTCVMYYIGSLILSGYSIVLLALTAMVSRCVLRSPSYLCDLCCPVSVVAERRVLRSAARGELLVPRARLAIMQRRAFSVVGPSAWNDLPFELRSLLMAHPSKFYFFLKSFFFVRDRAISIGTPLSSSLLKRRYIGLQNEWMNNYFNHVSAFFVFVRLLLKYVQYNLYIPCYFPLGVCCKLTTHSSFVTTYTD